MPPRRAEDLLTWMVLGVILGGRLGFVLFYQPALFRREPGRDPRGLAGRHVVPRRVPRRRRRRDRLRAARNGFDPLRLGDAVAAAAPIGLFFGRLANFINGELWGRPTTLPWGVVFPGADCPPGWPAACARHPSQLYEAGLEGARARPPAAGSRSAAARSRVRGRVIGLLPRRLRARARLRRGLPPGRRAVRDARQSVRPRAAARRLGPDHGPDPVAADAGGRAGAARLDGAPRVTPLEARLRGADRGARGRSASPSSWRSRSAIPSTATTRRATRSARRATSSPRPRSARCSAS